MEILHTGNFFFLPSCAFSSKIRGKRAKVSANISAVNEGSNVILITLSICWYARTIICFGWGRRKITISDHWCASVELFRNSAHFDLITTSKYSWHTMISPTGRQTAINWRNMGNLLALITTWKGLSTACAIQGGRSEILLRDTKWFIMVSSYLHRKFN